MDVVRRLPDDPLKFIKECIRKRQILWSHHVNIRMVKRCLSRKIVLESVDSYEIIESYPEDKYLPIYLVYAKVDKMVIHILFATDAENQNVRVVTVYRPDSEKWSVDFKRRKT